MDETVRDAIIVGAGPGGLQAAIYLGRFNRDVLVLDRGGGRTRHARSIENFLTHPSISGREIVERGIAQARSFDVQIERATVESLRKGDVFEVRAGDATYSALFVIAASGVSDNLPPIEGVHRFLGAGFYTCVDCDGHKTTGRKLVVIGESLKTLDLAVAMKKMFTRDISVVLYFRQAPEAYRELLAEEGIALMNARPVKILGEERVEGLELEGGRTVECEAIMSHFGFKLNDGYLGGLGLKRDARGFAYRVGATFESSVDGLYIVGPLNTGNDQAIIAAGEGAVAAIAINKRLLEL